MPTFSSSLGPRSITAAGSGRRPALAAGPPPLVADASWQQVLGTFCPPAMSRGGVKENWPRSRLMAEARRSPLHLSTRPRLSARSAATRACAVLLAAPARRHRSLLICLSGRNRALRRRLASPRRPRPPQAQDNRAELRSGASSFCLFHIRYCLVSTVKSGPHLGIDSAPLYNARSRG